MGIHRRVKFLFVIHNNRRVKMKNKFYTYEDNSFQHETVCGISQDKSKLEDIAKDRTSH